MKAKLKRIKALNENQFLIDLKKAYKVWIEAPQTGSFLYISKQEILHVSAYRKIHYTMREVSGQLFMTIQ